MAAAITIKLRVQSVDGAVITLQPALDSTISLLKEEVAREIQARAEAIILIFGDEQLENSRVLSSYHLLDNTLLRLEFRQVTISIPVRVPEGNVLVINAVDDWSVKTLKERVAEKSNGARPEMFALYCGQEEMKDDQMISEFNLSDETLNAVIQLHGGLGERQ